MLFFQQERKKRIKKRTSIHKHKHTYRNAFDQSRTGCNLIFVCFFRAYFSWTITRVANEKRKKNNRVNIQFSFSFGHICCLSVSADLIGLNFKYRQRDITTPCLVCWIIGAENEHWTLLALSSATMGGKTKRRGRFYTIRQAIQMRFGIFQSQQRNRMCGNEQTWNGK